MALCQFLPGPASSQALGLSRAGYGGALAAWAGFTLIWALPYWKKLRRNALAQAALAGINAAVVGLLLAAF